MTHIIIRSTVIAIAMTMTTISTQANTFYKWVDEQGVTHFSQNQPVDKDDVSQVKVKPQSVHSSPLKQDKPSQSDTDDKEMSEKEKLAQENERLKKERQAEQQQRLAQHCQQLRKNLANLNIGGKVYKMEDGERKYLDDRATQLKKEQVQREIGQRCNGVSSPSGSTGGKVA